MPESLTQRGRAEQAPSVLGMAATGPGGVYLPAVAAREDHYRFLRSVYFFASLRDEAVDQLVEVCQEESVEAGVDVFVEGAEPDRFYIVLEGIVQVWKGQDGASPELLAEHGRGHLFGEMALVDDLPRSATIRAKTATRLLCIQKRDFQRIVAADAAVALSVLKSLSSMVRQSNETYVDALRRRNAELEKLYLDLKRTQAQLLRHDRLAALGRFASLILHDVKNPLSMVRAYAELILHHLDNMDRIRDGAKVILSESDRLGALVNELLDYARGEIRLSLEAVNLPAFIESFLQTVSPRMRASGITVRRHVAFDGPVIMDERRILRVLHNLTDNAIKAMPQGGTYTLAVAAKDRVVCISVQDTGVGMTPEIKRRLFEPFFSSFESGGTGLGMAIARSIARAHHGDLTVVSQPSKGSRVTITIPMR
jgi:signal transduction histidine kinase